MADGLRENLDPPRATPKRKRNTFDQAPESIPADYSITSRPFSFGVPSALSASRSELPSFQGSEQPPTVPPHSPANGGTSPRGVQFAQHFGTLSIDRGGPAMSQAQPPSLSLAKKAKLTAALQSTHPPPTWKSSSDAETGDAPGLGNKLQWSKLDGPTSKSRSPKKRRTEPAAIFDPVRAALTWQDHEITVYDPNDRDDDGTGVNGLGFKPSTAMAHTRDAKRRQQLVECRKREENEARAKRSERRRGNARATMSAGPETPSRRVRFMEPAGAAAEGDPVSMRR